jgi:hypothetical protein
VVNFALLKEKVKKPLDIKYDASVKN